MISKEIVLHVKKELPKQMHLLKQRKANSSTSEDEKRYWVTVIYEMWFMREIVGL